MGTDERSVERREVPQGASPKAGVAARALLVWVGLWALMLSAPAFPLTPRLLDRVVPGSNVGLFTTAAGIVIVVLALAYVAVAACGRQPRIAPVPSAAGGVALYLVAYFAGFGLMPHLGSDALALLYGCVLGAGVFAMFVVWGVACAHALPGRIGFGGALAVLSLAMAGAVLANMALADAPGSLVAAVVAVAALASALVPFGVVAASRRSGARLADKATFGELVEMALGPGEGAAYAGGDAQPAGQGAEAPAVAWRALARRLALPVVVLAMYALAQMVSRSIEGNHALEPWSILAAAVLALAPLLCRDDSSRVALALRTVLPLFGVLVLGATALAPDAHEPVAASLGALMLCYAYGLTLFALLAHFADARVPSALGVLGGLFAALLAVLMVLPHITLRTLPGIALPLLLAALTLALALLAASPSLAAWGTSFSVAAAARAEGAGPAQGSPHASVQQACDAMADAYALSPREREILHYLGRGYGPRYLATILPIKENTIRSHVRNIYAKTDVHTQPELLELIDAYAS